MNTRTYNEIMAGLRELGSGSDYQIEKALSDGLQGKDFYASAEECRYLLWSYEEYLARSLARLIRQKAPERLASVV